MGKWFRLFAVLLAGSIFFLTGMSVPPVNTSKDISIYIVPHPDDEVLTYSVPIENDLRAGKKVYLVLLTAGEGSSALKRINERVEPDLTVEQFAQARIHDFRIAAEKLGVPRSHQFVHRIKGTVIQVKQAQLKTLVIYYAKKFPNATFHGMSAVDVHPEHRMIGIVLNDLYRKGIIKQKRTYSSIYMARFSGKPLPAGRDLFLNFFLDADKIDDALNVYETWDPDNGFYATGYYSVPAQFQAMHDEKKTRLSSK
jgi:LmbE family N-acetylglucosaminyl deacetylase